MYYNVLHPRFFVLQRITLYYKMYYIVLQTVFRLCNTTYYTVLQCITVADPTV